MTEPSDTCLVAMRDGVRHATDLYLPKRPGRVPAVLARTPYDRRGNPVWFAAIGRLFADAGMAFVVQDTRGHHGSEGDAHPFIHEPADGYDTCDWIVDQPWSDGTIALFGESYVGFTALAAAASHHPAIRAAALRNTASDIAGEWLRHQGVVRLEFVIRWALAAWSGRDNAAPELDWSIRPLHRIVPAAAPDRVPAVLDAWASEAGVVVPWQGGEWPSLIDDLRVPAHFTTGWWDLFARGAVRDWARHSSGAGVESRLTVEATDHAGHDWGDGPTADPLADFETLASRMPVVLANELAFLRRHLLGTSDGPPTAPVSWILTHAGARTSTSWPPPDAAPHVMHLVDGGSARRGPEGGGLSERPDHVPLVAAWRHDPLDLVPALEGEASGGLFRGPDERIRHVRDDVLTFTSDGLREQLDLAGPIVAELVVTPDERGGHVMATLSDVYPTGEARRIVDGACRLPTGGNEVRVAVDLGHTGYRLRRGHRLRLDVASSAFPRYIWHPGTGEDPWRATRTRTAETGLRIGPDGSVLRLTIRRTTAASPPGGTAAPP
jgi:putative CocE/NonD family hydrolase